MRVCLTFLLCKWVLCVFDGAPTLGQLCRTQVCSKVQISQFCKFRMFNTGRINYQDVALRQMLLLLLMMMMQPSKMRRLIIEMNGDDWASVMSGQIIFKLSTDSSVATDGAKFEQVKVKMLLLCAVRCRLAENESVCPSCISTFHFPVLPFPPLHQ